MKTLPGTVRFLAGHPLVKGRWLSLIYRYLTWQIRIRLNKEIETPWILGLRMIVRSHNKGFNGNIYAGLMEYNEMGFLLHLLEPDDLFIDVGAHVGSYTTLASGVCGARTLSFEGAAETAILLRRNVSLNGLDHLVEIREVAVLDASGEVEFRRGHDVWNRIKFRRDDEVVCVPMVRLDDVAGRSGAVMLKIDTNGTSDRVLAGAHLVLSDPSLLAVRCEDQFSDEPVAILAKYGFSRAAYDPAARTLTGIEPEDPGYYPLFVRDFEAVRARLAGAPRRRIMGRWI